MATEIIKTIKPGGGGDYVSIDAFNTGEARNLVAADEIAVGEVYSGGNALVTGGNLFAGFTTDLTRYVHIRAAAGEQHAGVWDTGKAYGSSSHITAAIQTNSRSLKLTQMQIESTAGTGGTGTALTLRPTIGGGLAEVDRCIIRIPDSATAAIVNRYTIYVRPETSTVSNIYNSVVMNLTTPGGTSGQAGMRINNGTGDVSVLNNTWVQLETYSNSQGIQNAGTGTIVVKNNYIKHGVANKALEGLGSATLSGNACSGTDADCDFENVLYSTANFTSVTLDSENLLLQPSSSLGDAGDDLSGSGITTDIVGIARPQFAAFDIGAFENEVPVCWNYTAPYKGSKRTFKLSGPGDFPSSLNVPGNVDTSKGKMIDDGQLIDPDNYDIL